MSSDPQLPPFITDTAQSVNDVPTRTGEISYAQFVNAYAALAFANTRGVIVGSALDVTWSLYGITEEPDVERWNAHLLDMLAGWLGAHGLPAFYIWSLETGGRFQLHSHVTLHLPEALETEFGTFVASILPAPTDPTSVPFKVQSNAAETTWHQWRRFRYTYKSLDSIVGINGRVITAGERSLVDICGISRETGGFMRIQRAGVSPALDAPARAAAGRHMRLPPPISAADPPVFNDRYLDWSAARQPARATVESEERD